MDSDAGNSMQQSSGADGKGDMPVPKEMQNYEYINSLGLSMDILGTLFPENRALRKEALDMESASGVNAPNREFLAKALLAHQHQQQRNQSGHQQSNMMYGVGLDLFENRGRQPVVGKNGIGGVEDPNIPSGIQVSSPEDSKDTTTVTRDNNNNTKTEISESIQLPGNSKIKTTRSSDTRGTGSYASRHQQAEARRRSRINERLEALRQIVPHTERANTTAFLEEVVRYVQMLQRRVMELELRLGVLPTVRPPSKPITFADNRVNSKKCADEPARQNTAKAPQPPLLGSPYIFSPYNSMQQLPNRSGSNEILQGLLQYLSNVPGNQNPLWGNLHANSDTGNTNEGLNMFQNPISCFSSIPMPSMLEAQALAQQLAAKKVQEGSISKTAESLGPGNENSSDSPGVQRIDADLDTVARKRARK